MKKLNRKGFTLVELLAVIVILAVIILVAVNNVLPQMDKARVNSFKSEALEFINGAESLYTTEQLSGPVSATQCYSIKKIVAEEIIKKNDIDNYTGCVCRFSDGSKYEWKIKLATVAYKIEDKTSKEISAFKSLADADPIAENNNSVDVGNDAYGTACPTT